MQARYYDPVTGRFYSNDPVDALGQMERGDAVHGFNRYVYANNNPLKYIDPNGEDPYGVSFGLGGTFGAKGSSHTTILFDTDTLELAVVTTKEVGLGVGKGVGAFIDAVWTEGDVSIDDFGGSGMAISGSATVVGGSMTLPASHHGVEGMNNPKENPGAIMEAGIQVGIGAEVGVTLSTSEVAKTTIIADIVDEVESWFED